MHRRHTIGPKSHSVKQDTQFRQTPSDATDNNKILGTNCGISTKSANHGHFLFAFGGKECQTVCEVQGGAHRGNGGEGGWGVCVCVCVCGAVILILEMSEG